MKQHILMYICRNSTVYAHYTVHSTHIARHCGKKPRQSQCVKQIFSKFIK